ncbi:ester cyclase [Candidatus Poribacteria bacterium]|nr:ester cyclase [Candidatus Poribacteria bacterium]
MRKASFDSISVITILLLGLMITAVVSCASSSNSAALQAEIDSLQAELKRIADERATIEKDLKTFDELDFDVFTGQKWDRLGESHAQDITVYWPDGHATKGIAVHIEDLKNLFVFAPDTRIKVHPIRFGSGEYTAVTGVFEGTFTKPMPIGNGEFIQPTGKAFKFPMCTIGIWKDGVMVTEHLFWDNQTFMKQIGLAK